MENTAYYPLLSEGENYAASANFFNEHFLDDAMAIENGHVREQLSAYLLESNEDNTGRGVSSLQKLAKSSAVKSSENICQKQDCNWRYECKK